MTSDSSVYPIGTRAVGYPSQQHEGVSGTWRHSRMCSQLLSRMFIDGLNLVAITEYQRLSHSTWETTSIPLAAHFRVIESFISP